MIEVLLFRKKEILIGMGATLLLALGLISYFASGPSVSDYLAAETAYSEWLSSPKDEARYGAMQQAFRKAPALKKKYESAIAQKLLVIGRTEEGLEMAEKILKRSLKKTTDHSPLHTAFALGSLWIEQGHYQKALEQAVALKEQMADQQPFILYSEVLIRIASLQQQLHNLPGERAALEELQAHLEKDPEAADLILGAFSESQVDLKHYLADRQKNIS